MILLLAATDEKSHSQGTVLTIQQLYVCIYKSLNNPFHISLLLMEFIVYICSASQKLTMHTLYKNQI